MLPRYVVMGITGPRDGLPNDGRSLHPAPDGNPAEWKITAPTVSVLLSIDGQLQYPNEQNTRIFRAIRVWHASCVTYL